MLLSGEQKQSQTEKQNPSKFMAWMPPMCFRASEDKQCCMKRGGNC